MFQNFETRSRPADGPPRLAALRQTMAEAGLEGFLVPRADAHQGEYVAPCDERLAWLTGFTGSAGFCAVLAQTAGLFVDGRYRLQVRDQADLDSFTPVNWPEIRLGPWLKDQVSGPARIGFDPWLHTPEEIETLTAALAGTRIAMVPSANLIDRIWTDRPTPPAGPAERWPDHLAGNSAAEKRARIARTLTEAGQTAAVLTLPDSISWLLNIRGQDLPRIPVVQAFALIDANGAVTLFADPAKFAAIADHLGKDVRISPTGDFETALAALTGPVRVDRGSAPLAVVACLETAGVKTVFAPDPCILPKACKTPAEIAGAKAAGLRDAAAMANFLCWLDTEIAALVAGTRAPLTEIDVVTALEGFRRATNQLRDISFDTICGSGPHGAITHYRVTRDTNRALCPGDLVLVDSGGQYLDGTTDITRTIAVGPVGQTERDCFTRVLQGMIAISRARWPAGLAGRDLDALARYPLWLAGQDYDHGTGHGIGAYLSVHEGPQRLSRISTEPLKEGMILSNEPGYYRAGAFGIRIENLIAVGPAEVLAGGDDRTMHGFQTLTHVPIDLRLIEGSALSVAERSWLNSYHRDTRDRLMPLVDATTRDWLENATRAL
ncbi:MAG: aminopeptidase P family protein [Qingshengfaniella sp.]